MHHRGVMSFCQGELKEHKTKIHIPSKHIFIIPTDAHNYKIIGMLETIKIPTISPTCFGSRKK
jgi:hypothetical protein